MRGHKQGPRRRKRERHLKKQLDVSAIIFRSFQGTMLAKCRLTTMELNYYQWFRDKKKLKSINLAISALVVLTIEKQVISRGG